MKTMEPRADMIINLASRGAKSFIKVDIAVLLMLTQSVDNCVYVNKLWITSKRNLERPIAGKLKVKMPVAS